MPQPYGTPDDENPEWTEEMLRTAKRGSEVLPRGFLAKVRRRGKQKSPTKQMISLRVDRDVLSAFRATGRGWQARINETLARHLPRRAAGTAALKKATRKRAR